LPKVGILKWWRGVAVGAVPIAVAVSLASGRPYAIIRREEKDHGKAGTIIGDVSGRGCAAGRGRDHVRRKRSLWP